MNKLKKLMNFIYKDEFSLSIDELKNRIELVALEQASENGWTDILVDFSADHVEGQFKCYSVNVYCRESSSADDESSADVEESSVPYFISAASIIDEQSLN